MTVFNPLYNNSKTPFGAVPEGTTVFFDVKINYCDGCSGGLIEIFDENMQPAKSNPLVWQSCKDGAEHWRAQAEFECTGLFFYRFTLQTADGQITLGCGEHGDATPDCQNCWQQTVYAVTHAPESFAGGTMYQIFPDRFCGGDNPLPCPFKDRIVVKDLDKTPDYTDIDVNFAVKNVDYYGGNLDGIVRRLDYLEGLGVSVIYLNPIFEAHSNHRYNTADYNKIDPLLGDETAFTRLCAEAGKRGIKIILDGVFSHTGSDSVYFNAARRYDSVGAANDKNSPYCDWYRFTCWPDAYECWWDVETLPNVNESCPSFTEFITGENGVIRKWLRLGASGWRLDVADELPEEFIRAVTAAAKEEKPDSVIIGEVWENASSKISYGQRRHYLLGGELDSVMNYPAANAIIEFVKNGGAQALADTLTEVYSDYPKCVCDRLMNHLGTHDTPRLITRLAGERTDGMSRSEQAVYRLTAQQYAKGLGLVKMASAISYMIYGLPCVYYGDEIGMQGCSDPFNRGYMQWDDPEGGSLWVHYTKLGRIRRDNAFLATADFRVIKADGGLLVFERSSGDEALVCAVNAGDECAVFNCAATDELVLAEGCEKDAKTAKLRPGGFCIIKPKKFDKGVDKRRGVC